MTEIEQKLWRRVKRYRWVFKLVPFIRMVAVCNTLAFGRVNEKSDIDIFIVAKRGRLFLVRILVVFWFQILGVRRYGEKITGRFCLSFFVDDSALDLSSVALKQDVYLAYWMKSMVIVADDGVSKNFLEANSWVEDYFESGAVNDLKRAPFSWKIVHRGFWQCVFQYKFGDFLERNLKNWQMKRAKGKATALPDASGIVVSEHMLKFHNNDRRLKYRQVWLQLFGENTKITDDRFLALRLDS